MGDALARAFQRAWRDAALRRGRPRRPESRARHGIAGGDLDSLGLPYRFFGFDSAISEVVNYAKRVDEWMQNGGRAAIAAKLGIGGGAATAAAARQEAR